MGRFAARAESQTAQPAGTPSGTTFNGFWLGLMAGAAANYKLRRLGCGVRVSGGGVPTSQQYTMAIYRQTVRVVGTGFGTTTGQNLDPRGAATAITGADITTAAAAGTTGPTLGANPLYAWSLNTQSLADLPYELLEELICDQGTANGLALVNIGSALPANHLFVASLEWEE